MPALGLFVTTTTQTRLLPKVIDQVLNGNVLTMRLLRQAVPWRTGTQINIPVNLADITAVGSYFGFDALSVTQENIRQRAAFDPSQYFVSIPISGIQTAINQGREAIISLVATEIDWRAKRLRDEMGNGVYSDGTGNAGKDILGIRAAIDDTTLVATYGGINKTTFPRWNATVTAQVGALGLPNLAADFDAAQRGDDAPTLMVTTPAVFSIYEALLTPTVSHQFSQNDYRLVQNTGGVGSSIVRVGGVVAAGQGFRALTFRGIPFVSDEKCTAAEIYTINENHLSFYIINRPNQSIKNGFAWTGFKEPVNQDAVVGQLLWAGQLVCDAPRTMARRTGVLT